MPYINTYTLIINKLLLKAKEVTNKKLIAYIGVKNLEFFCLFRIISLFIFIIRFISSFVVLTMCTTTFILDML